MKNYELVSILNGLKGVSELENSVPVSIGFKIVKNKKMIETEMEAFDEMKNKIIEQYADEKGEVKATNPKYAECIKKLNDLSLQDTNDISFKTIKISEIESLELPMNAISALAFMIKEE